MTEQSSALMSAGLDAFNKADYHQAIEHLEKIVQTDPLNFEARLYLSKACVQMTDTFSAEKHLVFIRDHCQDLRLKVEASNVLSRLGGRRMSGVMKAFK